MRNITGLIESEINAIIFNGAQVDEHKAMPLWVAEQVINMNHLSQHLRDWAWDTLDSAPER